MRKLFSATLVVLFVAMFCVFAPTGKQAKAMWSLTDNLKPADLIPYEQAYQRAKALSRVLNEQPISGRLYYQALKEHRTLWHFKEKDDEFVGEPWKRNRVPLHNILNNQFHQFNQWVSGMYSNPEQKLLATNLLAHDPEFQRIQNFRRYTYLYHWGAIGEYVQFKLFCMVLLSALFYACLLMRRSDGINPLLELGNPVFYLAVLSGPFGLLFYSAEAREQTRRAVKWVSYATAACVSGFAGAPAQAQTVKTESGKKSKTTATLTVDVKNSSVAGSSPDSQSVRTSLYKGRFLAEQITLITPSASGWYNEAGGGVFIKKTPKTWLMAVGLVGNNNLGRRNLIAGFQFLRFGKRYTLTAPAIRYEHGLDGGNKSLSFVTNPVIRFGDAGVGNRVGVAPEVSLKKTFGKPIAWTIGAGVRVFPGKGRKNSVELGVLKNQLGLWSLRSRLTVNFAF